MLKNIDRLNSPDNVWGYSSGRILIGSKIIKQSYNFKAIRHVKFTAKPPNIATLIQIMGRARRKNAHSLLPLKYRTVEVSIYVSSLPHEKGLSHEEEKYKEKIEDYKIIQIIERELNRYAIDAVMARNIILPGLNPSGKPGIGALWFDTRPGRFSYPINLNTFIPFHSDDEIKVLIYIIKRLFIEISSVFTFKNLWNMAQKPPFHVELDTQMFDKDNFIIALSKMVYSAKDDPIIRESTLDLKEDILDILYSEVDKRILQGDGTLGYIHHIDEYYMFIPFRGGKHEIYAESPFRNYQLSKNKPINIVRYMKDSVKHIDYKTQRAQFKLKYDSVPLEKLSSMIGKFGITFHQLMAEEIIKYIFDIWTNPSATQISEWHEFYYKILYFYNIIGLIVWASEVNQVILENYKPFILPIKSGELTQKSKNIPGLSSSSSSGSSINKINQGLSIKMLAHSLKATQKMFAERGSKDKRKLIKAPASELPIGHFIVQTPRFYLPKNGWYDVPDYNQHQGQEFKENNIVVGYYERTQEGLNIKFKIRPPIQNLKNIKDARAIEKGSVCASNNKDDLIKIAKSLKLTIPPKVIVPILCEQIETELQRRELEERNKKSNIRYFYSFGDANPITAQHYQSSSSSSPNSPTRQALVASPTNAKKGGFSFTEEEDMIETF